MRVCEVGSCTGCFACLQKCPKAAIKIGYDENSKTIPIVDKALCVNCGLCKKVCPINQKIELSTPKICYAMWTRNEQDRKLCSSGGISTGLARYFIENKGSVFGVGELKNDCFEIQSAENENEIVKFIGSRYVQCSTGNSYVEVNSKLKAGQLVLYVGTPCQIAGLKGYLGKEYTNLYTVDIICHGVPPMTYLMNYVREQCPNQKIGGISFRGKYDFKLSVYDESGTIIYQKPCREDIYFDTFLDALTYRDNCYECRYAKTERVADITIGDFWELDKNSLQNQYDGRISAVLVNTDKGMELVEQSKDYFVLEERDIAEAVKTNDQLREPSRPHEDRATFLKAYKEQGSFKKAVKATNLYRRKTRKAIIKGNLRNTKVWKIMKKVKQR